MRFSKNEIMSHLYDCTSGKCKKKISGWWKDSAFEIYEAINQTQKRLKIEGNLCEIGTWYGRSFLPLRNFTEDHETCIGIDIFKAQYYTDLINNIKKCYGTLERSEIIKVTAGRSDEKIKALESYAPIRMFYIDGDHSYKGALLDLNVAKDALHRDGIMFLDDYQNPMFSPDIVKAVSEFLNENKEFALAFSMSDQWVFLCQAHMVDIYVEMMKNLNWIVSNDGVWSSLINFKHPLGDNPWAVHKELNT